MSYFVGIFWRDAGTEGDKVADVFGKRSRMETITKSGGKTTRAVWRR